MTNLSGANLNNGAAVGPQGEGRESPSRFPKYPEYKDSGVEWLGAVPTHWVVKKLKREIIAQSGTDQKYDGGDFPLFGANGVIGETNTASIQSACVLIGRVGSAGEINFISQTAGVSDNALIVSNQIFNAPRYDFYLFHAIDIKSSVSKNAQPLITASSFRDRIVAVPMDVCERLQIARFLDHETARIDALIEEQQRLIELLKEKRQAVISHAVTKGLDPTVPMKDSGVEWLGEVPAHWDFGSFRRAIKSVSNGTTADQVDEDANAIAVSRIETISTGEINFEKVGYVKPEDAASRFILKCGDILFSHINSLSMIGNVALYRGSRPLLHGMNLLRIQPASGVMGEWIFYWLKSKNIRQEVESRAKPAINQASISTDSVRSLPVLIPPESEQIQIVRHLDCVVARIDTLTQETVDLVALLQERRSALISAAVTGKIDVRGWQPPASTQTPEFEVAEAH